MASAFRVLRSLCFPLEGKGFLLHDIWGYEWEGPVAEGDPTCLVIEAQGLNWGTFMLPVAIQCGFKIVRFHTWQLRAPGVIVPLEKEQGALLLPSLPLG